MLSNVTLAPWAIIIVDTWMWTPYVMLICLAGLRSIPDYIYEAAEVDRASNWRQFWSITLPMALPFIMLAVLFRGIENFKMFDMVNLLTGGGPGSTTEVASITLKREAFEKLAHRLLLGLRHHPLRRGLRPRQHLRQGAEQGEEPMSAAAHSVVEPSPTSKRVAGDAGRRLCADLDDPAVLDLRDQLQDAAGFDRLSAQDRCSRRRIEGYCNLFTTRTRQTPEYINSLPPATSFCDETTRKRNMVIAGPSNFLPRFVNSLIIAFGSTFCAVFLGTLAAYGFSRFKVPLADDLLFFILSTRMMPPIAVAIPIYLMYRELGLSDTALGMILLYTAVNVSLAVWLLKGFIDEIPREYEEAAMIDGYTRLQAFRKVVLPQATTGIAATAIFCLIFAWNEYAFAVAADLRHGADRAALHPDHHRRGRPGLAGGGRRNDDLPGADPGLHHPAAQAAAARHHLRSGAQMSTATAKKRRVELARLAAPRAAGEHRDGDHRHRLPDAVPALRADALHLVVRHDAGRHRDVHHRLEVSGVGDGRDPRRKPAGRNSDRSSRSRIPTSSSTTASSSSCSGRRAAARRRRCA